jgi:hypothetical protein
MTTTPLVPIPRESLAGEIGHRVHVSTDWSRGCNYRLLEVNGSHAVIETPHGHRRRQVHVAFLRYVAKRVPKAVRP